MQQTQTYQFNKIDLDDNFSPAPLNENMDKVEAALAALAGADAALDSRVTTLEAHKVAAGTYIGNGAATGQEINLGFYPRVVFAQYASTGVVMATRAKTFGNGAITLTENGFRAVSTSGNGNMNGSGGTYLYCAIL